MPRKRKRLLVLFGNQLFSSRHIAQAQPDAIFMAESDSMCRRYRAHQHKLVLVLSAMRSKADALRKAGHSLFYEKLEDSAQKSFESMLREHLSRRSYEEIIYFETESFRMDSTVERLGNEHGVEPRRLRSPMFLTSPEEIETFRSHSGFYSYGFFVVRPAP